MIEMHNTPLSNTVLAQMEVTSQVIQQHIEMASKNSESKL